MSRLICTIGPLPTRSRFVSGSLVLASTSTKKAGGFLRGSMQAKRVRQDSSAPGDQARGPGGPRRGRALKKAESVKTRTDRFSARKRFGDGRGPRRAKLRVSGRAMKVRKGRIPNRAKRKQERGRQTAASEAV